MYFKINIYEAILIPIRRKGPMVEFSITLNRACASATATATRGRRQADGYRKKIWWLHILKPIQA